MKLKHGHGMDVNLVKFWYQRAWPWKTQKESQLLWMCNASDPHFLSVSRAEIDFLFLSAHRHDIEVYYLACQSAAGKISKIGNLLKGLYIWWVETFFVGMSIVWPTQSLCKYLRQYCQPWYWANSHKTILVSSWTELKKDILEVISLLSLPFQQIGNESLQRKELLLDVVKSWHWQHWSLSSKSQKLV